MKILILEDSYYMIDLLKSEFEEQGWDYDVANKVVAAMDFCKKNQYDAYVIDLHVDPLGLTEEEFNVYNPYYGWAWFYNYVIKSNEANASLLKKKAIIYSKYANEFRYTNYKYETYDITIIGKDEVQSDEKVIKAIKQLEKNKKQ